MNGEDLQITLESRFRRVSPDCYHRDHDPGFGTVFERGTGSILIDADGAEWIDLTCGYSATNFGHCNDELVSALMAQANRLCHVTGDPHEPRVVLAERLAENCYPDVRNTKVLFSSSGARAIEAAWKAAVSFRPGKVISLAPSLHGRSIATSQLGATPATRLSESLTSLSIVQSADDYPYCSSCPLGLHYPGCTTRCADSVVRFIADNSEEISAVLVEPALTARGYVFPPAEYFVRLRECTERHGVLMIADEVQSGMGRCGSMLLSRSQGWTPDLVALGKSLGGGIMPLAAVIGRGDVLDAIPAGAESETASGSPLACAVGIAALELLEKRGLAARGAEIGKQLRRFAQKQSNELGLGCQIEGIGACCVLEFSQLAEQLVAKDSRRLDATRSARQFATRCAERKLKVHLSGPNQTRVVLLPALTMTDDELQVAQDRLVAVGESFADGEQSP